MKNEARQSLTTQVTDNLSASSRYVAEILSKKLFENLGGAAAILEEGTRDRVSFKRALAAFYLTEKLTKSFWSLYVLS